MDIVYLSIIYKLGITFYGNCNHSALLDCQFVFIVLYF